MNVKLGKYNQLEVVKEVDFGVYLDGGDDGEILLPTRYVPEGCKPGDVLNVFLYLINEFGAFLNWGLMKDLFVPFREQKMKMQKGRKYIIHAHIDEDSYRIMASAKVEHYLSKEHPDYRLGQEVDILIWQKTDLGFKAIVENKFSGLLYDNEIFQPLETGMRLKAYVKQVREDGKIDLVLQKLGAKKVDDFSEVLLQYIKDHEGFTPLNDKSAAEDIYDAFGVSKKTFKKAVGDLYKKRLVVLEAEGIRLT